MMNNSNSLKGSELKGFSVKGSNCSPKDMWKHVSDYRILLIMKDRSLCIHGFASFICFTYKNKQTNKNTNKNKKASFKIAPTIRYVSLSKSSKIFSSDHTILFKFHQPVVEILITELETVF